MASSSVGSKQQPWFADGDAPDVAVNVTQVANYAAYVGNYIADTNAARINFTTAAWEGLDWWAIDTNVLWKFTDGAWREQRPLQVTPASLDGAAHDTLSPIITKTGSVVVATNGTGIGSVAWTGGAFPNGLISVSLTNADDAAFGGWFNSRGSTRTNCVFAAKTAVGSAAASTSVRISYTAIGW